MEIVTDRQRCIGSGVCVMRLPDVFGSDEGDGLVEVLDTTGAGHGRDELEDTADACPSQSIVVQGH